MNSIRRSLIHRLADQIRQQLDLTFPVDVTTAVTRLRGKIEDDELPPDVDAKISRDGDSFCITMNSARNTMTVRDRFTIAHELGHLFLHMGYLIDPQKWASTPDYMGSAFYRYGYSEEELEANEFAAAFLMPERVYLKQIDQHMSNGSCDIGSLAEYFGVSHGAAKNRGKWLKVFNW